jgi:Fic family protein
MKRSDLSPNLQATLARLPPPHANAFAVVPPPPPESGVTLGSVSSRHLEAEKAMATVDAYAATLHDPYVVSRILTRQEAVSSSAIEGTHSTLDELLAAEETHDQEARTSVKLVRGYALALQSYVQRAGKHGPPIFTEQLLRNIHRRVMRADPDYLDTPGLLRARTVWIGGHDIAYSTFNPPPADQVARCLADTVAYMRAEGLHAQQQSLLTRMAIAHAHFEAVHPFRDGNGRVGRLLLPMMMAAEGRTPLYLSAYIEANKTGYYAALKAAQQREDWAAMVGFLADAVVGSTTELMATRTALSRLEALWRYRRRFRAGSSALGALGILPQYPVVTIGRLAELLNVSFPAASKAISQLCDIGVLQERTGYSRNRIFSAPEALSIMNRPFGAQPILPG